MNRRQILPTLLLLLLTAAGAAPRPTPDKPNIVWFLTDDQDQMLGGSFPISSPGGATPMPQTKQLLADAGATAGNFFIHTPICCPSRSELVSGRYFHNIKRHGAGPACMHVDEDRVNNSTFAKELHAAGYTVGMFGKYLNSVPKYVPEGFDAWMANGGGNYIAPAFQTFGLSDLGRAHGWHIPDCPDKMGCFSTSDANYTTAVVGNVSAAWIRKVVGEDPARPFFAYVAPKAAHEPFIPAPWYVDHWDAAWPAHEIRPAPWNASMESRADHHGNIATNPLLTAEAAAVVTGVFRERWRTLMSVDDVIAAVVRTCEELGVADNTYFFYSSDHGFQLGEFNIIMDKRHVYEWDTRIHLLARGPGIAPGSSWAEPATQVDMAPTFLGLAGIEKPARMDGKSLVPLLVTGGRAATVALPPSVRRHLGARGDAAAYRDAWRSSVFLEYYYVDWNVKCALNSTPPLAKMYPHRDVSCAQLEPGKATGECWGPGSGPAPGSDCYRTEDPTNNWIALRSFSSAKSPFGDTTFAEFATGVQGPQTDIDFSNVSFVELYDNAVDKWQMSNLAKTAPRHELDALHAELHKWYNCAGDTCP